MRSEKMAGMLASHAEQPVGHPYTPFSWNIENNQTETMKSSIMAIRNCSKGPPIPFSQINLVYELPNQIWVWHSDFLLLKLN